MASSSTPRIRTYKAGGAINPLSYVKLSTSSPGSTKNPVVVQCGAGDRPIGIAQNDSAAASGDEVEVALPGGGARLTIKGTVASGNFIKSDANGYGIATTTAGDAYGAQAVEDGVTTDILGVEVIIGEKYNATA